MFATQMCACAGLCVQGSHFLFFSALGAHSYLHWHQTDEHVAEPQTMTHNDVIIQSDSRTRTDIHTDTHIRFPLYAPLFDLLTSFFTRHVPAEFWLGENYDLTPDKELCAQLKTVMTQLEQEVVIAWNRAVSSHFTDASAQYRVFWLLEDWHCGATVLRVQVCFKLYACQSAFTCMCACVTYYIVASVSKLGRLEE